ncbi:MAG: energy transducer TonB [Bacteroidales bacterium]|nr:energy transducer TonB [Bacteroidales bacterium]
MKRLPREDRAGLYITVIVHLVVLIVLLAAQLNRALSPETSFVLDFTKMEEMEKLQKEIAMKEELSRKLQDLIGDVSTPVRNVAVDRASLKDDRGTDAEQLYKDAERLQKELQAGFSEPEDDYAAVPEKTPEKLERKKEEHYGGASVLSYYLEGRKASSTPIPAYRCMGAGEVKVNITVDPNGTVMMARVDEGSSSSDACLKAFAIRAARMSKFSKSTSAPPKQSGYIIYQFIAQ